MNDGTRKLLFDVLEAGQTIQDFVQRMTLADYPPSNGSLKFLAEAFVRLCETDAERLCSILKLYASSVSAIT